MRLRTLRGAPTINTAEALPSRTPADYSLPSLNSLPFPATLHPEARIPLPDDDSQPASPDSDVPSVFLSVPADDESQAGRRATSDEIALDSLLHMPVRGLSRPMGSENRKVAVPDEEEEGLPPRRRPKSTRRRAALHPAIEWDDKIPLGRKLDLPREQEAAASSSAVELDPEHNILIWPRGKPSQSAQRRPYRAR